MKPLDELALLLLTARYRLDAVARGYLRAAGAPLPRSLPGDPRAYARALATARFFPACRDWEWPYWAVGQYDPAAAAAPPAVLRAERNTTRRAWTALGLPGHARRAAVDPRGLVTPWPDGIGWSLDAWVRLGGSLYAPGRAAQARQAWQSKPPAVVTTWTAGPLAVEHRVMVIEHEREPWALVEVTLANPATAPAAGDLVFALRPYNPEGIARAWRVEYRGLGWYVAGHLALVAPPPAAFGVSNGERGDVAGQLDALSGEDYAFDAGGLATGAATYPFALAPAQEQAFVAAMPLSTSRVFAVGPLPLQWHVKFRADLRQAWSVYLGDSLAAQWPDARLQAAFDANKEHLLVAWTGNGVMRGPLATPAFRFRESAYVVHALDGLGLHFEAQHVLRPYLARLKGDGRFADDGGEPAANGQALWALWQHYYLTGDQEFAQQMAPAAHAGAAWILKRRRTGRRPAGAEGLLPATPATGEYSAWDNFWSAAGLRAAAEFVRAGGGDPAPYEQGFREYWAALEQAWAARGLGGGPAEALVALAPLRLVAPDDPRIDAALRATAFRDGAFDDAAGDTAAAMRLAECCVLRRSREAWPIVAWLLDRASGTWAWPESLDAAAGEGHSSWATAAWLSLMRSLLLFEDGQRLVVTPALPPEWTRPGAVVGARQAPTAFGRVDFALSFGDRCATLALAGRWRTPPDEIELNLPVPPASARAARARVEVAGPDAVRVVAPGTAGELRVDW